MSRLTRADVEHVAQLARLALTDEEIEHFTGQLEVILEHAAQIAALDTHDVPPTAHPLPIVNVFRVVHQAAHSRMRLQFRTVRHVNGMRGDVVNRGRLIVAWVVARQQRILTGT